MKQITNSSLAAKGILYESEQTSLSVSGFCAVRHERCALLHPQQRNLLGDQAEHENNHRRRQEKHRHIGETMFRDICVDIVGDA